MFMSIMKWKKTQKIVNERETVKSNESKHKSNIILFAQPNNNKL